MEDCDARNSSKPQARTQVLSEALSSGVLPALLKMITAVSNLDPGAAATGFPSVSVICESDEAVSRLLAITLPRKLLRILLDPEYHARPKAETVNSTDIASLRRYLQECFQRS